MTILRNSLPAAPRVTPQCRLQRAHTRNLPWRGSCRRRKQEIHRADCRGVQPPSGSTPPRRLLFWRSYRDFMRATSGYVPTNSCAASARLVSTACSEGSAAPSRVGCQDQHVERRARGAVHRGHRAVSGVDAGKLLADLDEHRCPRCSNERTAPIETHRGQESAVAASASLHARYRIVSTALITSKPSSRSANARTIPDGQRPHAHGLREVAARAPTRRSGNVPDLKPSSSSTRALLPPVTSVTIPTEIQCKYLLVSQHRRVGGKLSRSRVHIFR